MNVVKVVRLVRWPILRQVQLEEALLRADSGNWCILNDGAESPAVVLGISGKPEELVHVDAAKRARVPLIKRFTGGGTVVVDADTLFSTLIMQEEAVPGLECFPRPIMRWSETFYSRVFGRWGDFSLQEHDYVFGNRKFGGNAQAITKRRWLHHTSFLWDYAPRNMALLKHPNRTPEYRQGRDHESFLCRLNEYLPSRDLCMVSVVFALLDQGFQVVEVPHEEAEKVLEKDHIRHTVQLSV